MSDDFILVTGGAGFIGVNLVHHLISNTPYGIINLDKLTYAGNIELLDDLAGNSRIISLYMGISEIGNLSDTCLSFIIPVTSLIWPQNRMWIDPSLMGKPF